MQLDDKQAEGEASSERTDDAEYEQARGAGSRRQLKELEASPAVRPKTWCFHRTVVEKKKRWRKVSG